MSKEGKFQEENEMYHKELEMKSGERKEGNKERQEGMENDEVNKNAEKDEHCKEESTHKKVQQYKDGGRRPREWENERNEEQMGTRRTRAMTREQKMRTRTTNPPTLMM